MNGKLSLKISLSVSLNESVNSVGHKSDLMPELGLHQAPDVGGAVAAAIATAAAAVPKEGRSIDAGRVW